jgi:hypothetical protein
MIFTNRTLFRAALCTTKLAADVKEDAHRIARKTNTRRLHSQFSLTFTLCTMRFFPRNGEHRICIPRILGLSCALHYSKKCTLSREPMLFPTLLKEHNRNYHFWSAWGIPILTFGW